MVDFDLASCDDGRGVKKYHDTIVMTDVTQYNVMSGWWGYENWKHQSYRPTSFIQLCIGMPCIHLS